jgi:molybdopterin-binding protein
MGLGRGNCLKGTVVEIKKGTIMTRVEVDIDSGEIITAMVTDAALKELAPRVGAELEVLIDSGAGAGRYLH